MSMIMTMMMMMMLLSPSREGDTYLCMYGKGARVYAQGLLSGNYSSLGSPCIKEVRKYLRYRRFIHSCP